jgi:hypothetical protein
MCSDTIVWARSHVAGCSFQINFGTMNTSLNEVFGIATKINPASYVNRGGLDKLLGYYLKTQRHVAIHGDSKQGKSWLRGRLLDAADTIVVQCQVDSTTEAIFREALGILGVRAEIKRTGVATYQGELDFSAGGELGNLVMGKAKVDASAAVAGGGEREIQTRPIGTTPADLSWVARTFKASQRRLVIEDFHYVTEENRKDFAFALKALGDRAISRKRLTGLTASKSRSVSTHGCSPTTATVVDSSSQIGRSSFIGSTAAPGGLGSVMRRSTWPLPVRPSTNSSTSVPSSR